MKKKYLIIILLLGILVFAYFNIAVPLRRAVTEVIPMEIEAIDLMKVADGQYSAGFGAGLSKYEVEVEVVDHRIQNIIILSGGSTDYATKARVVIENIVNTQKNVVDSVSGATISSKGLMKAVELSLKKGLNE